MLYLRLFRNMDVRIRLIPMRGNQQTVKANKACTGKPVAHFSSTHVVNIPERSQRCLYRETNRGNVDYRIPGIPHSTDQKEDTNRKETVKRLIQQFENHPNRDSLKQDLNKTEEINPFSEESKDLITDMGNTERKSSSSTRLLQRNNARIAPYVGKSGFIYCTCGNASSQKKGIDN